MRELDYPLPEPLITASPHWLAGEPCFTGRRVAVKAMFDYLKAGHTLEHLRISRASRANMLLQS